MLRSFYLIHGDVVLYAFTQKTDGPVWKPGAEERFKSTVRNERRISKRANRRIRKKAALGVLKLTIGLRDWYIARGWNVYWHLNRRHDWCWADIPKWSEEESPGEDHPDVEG